MPRRSYHSEVVAELAARRASAHEMQHDIRAQLRQLRRRECKARARSRSSWRDMITFGVRVFTIIGEDFSWVPRLLSRFQQTAEPEEVKEAITKAYLELSAAEIEALLAPEGRVSKYNAASQAHTVQRLEVGGRTK